MERNGWKDGWFQTGGIYFQRDEFFGGNDLLKQKDLVVGILDVFEVMFFDDFYRGELPILHHHLGGILKRRW